MAVGCAASPGETQTARGRGRAGGVQRRSTMFQPDWVNIRSTHAVRNQVTREKCANPEKIPGASSRLRTHAGGTAVPDRASGEAISHFYTSTHGPRRIAFFRDFATTAGGRPRRLTARPGAGATSRVRRERTAVEMSHPAPTRRAPGRAKRDFRAKGANLATLRPSYGIARAAPPSCPRGLWGA